MRPHLISALAVLVAAAGCVDSVGLDDDARCEAEMRALRHQRGVPDQVLEGATSERWFYDAGTGPRVFYEFSWGGGTCRVTGPVAFGRGPAQPLLPSQWQGERP